MLLTKTKSGKFIVMSLYTALELGTLVSFPSNFIWKAWVQSKVSFFAWEVTWGKVLALDQVQKRGRSLANRCFLCHTKEKSTDHLLIQCVEIRI